MNNLNNPLTSSMKPTISSMNSTDDQQHLDAKAYASSSSSSMLLSTLDSSLSGDANRKKSGFMIINRVDKASVSSALENESDMEADYFTDRGGANCRSPGSSSIVSENSSIFDENVPPSTEKTIPRIALQQATPVLAPVPIRPSELSSSPTISKPVVAPLVGILDQQNTTLTSIVSQSPAASSGKESASSLSTSRFHIIKLDSGPYKRGRWNCRDFDESCSGTVSLLRTDMIAVGGPKSGSSNSSGKQSYYVLEESGKGAGDGVQNLVMDANMDQQRSILNVSLNTTTDSDRSVSPTPNNVSINLSIQKEEAVLDSNPSSILSTSLSRQQKLWLSSIPTNSGIALNNAAAALLDSIMVGQGRHYSSAGDGANGDGSLGTAISHPAGMEVVQNAGPASASPTIVAIDNKIEQAMDLVKTHLLYAVREEVEVLKEKIVDLEKKVFRLEAENKLLREYAPPEILQQIQQQSGHGNAASPNLNTATNPAATMDTLSPAIQAQLTLKPSSGAITPSGATNSQQNSEST